MSELAEERGMLPRLRPLCNLAAPIAEASPFLGFQVVQPEPVVEPRMYSLLFGLAVTDHPVARSEIAAARTEGRTWSVMNGNGILLAKLAADGRNLTVCSEQCADIIIRLPAAPHETGPPAGTA